ncbi:MAG: Na-K-Cl cotransporter [Candidatus Rifleibacteriota bacterium]
MGNPAKNEETAGNKFGTFGGVFTPSILTIFGVIMFMRANFVVGQAGIRNAILILLAAKAITFLTSLSVSAIATNMQVRGGGAYFMISRVLGPEFGGAIGIALFFAQALSVPFYLIGFSEAVLQSLPGHDSWFLGIALTSAALLFVIAYVGAGWAIKAQYFIMAILFASISTFLIGAAENFSLETLKANWASGYTSIDGQSGNYDFWLVFAIYFPAVTGILAGINMSGDLKNPAESIPAGTFAAVGVGFIVYLVQMILCGGAFSRESLIEKPYETLVNNAFLGAGFLVSAGVYAATLSSALGSYLGAPRILQAVARDGIVEQLRFFSVGSPKTDEPRRAMILTGLITFLVIIWAGNDSGGKALNMVASIITMFFLFTYGMVNMAAFTEAYSHNPSFRPRFRYFHWLFALLGGLGCIGSAFLIDSKAAAAAIVLLYALFRYVRNKELNMTFGDARRGFIFANVRDNLLRLSSMEEDSRNWRPTILVFSGNPASRETLATYAVWFESGRGIVIMANILVGSLKDLLGKREIAEKQLKQFCAERNMHVFPQVVVAESISAGVNTFLQGTAIGPIRPNLVMFGWPEKFESARNLIEYIKLADASKIGQLLLSDKGLPEIASNRRIDVWWRGRKNGSLMVLLAHLLLNNWEWRSAKIRVLRVVENDAGIQPAMEALQILLDNARVQGQAKTLIADKPFAQILGENSYDAALVFLGFEIPEDDSAEKWFNAYECMLKGLPTTVLVHCASEGDFLE